jgi:5-formyltetrahydrofolate cyclo-ligase
MPTKPTAKPTAKRTQPKAQGADPKTKAEWRTQLLHRRRVIPADLRSTSQWKMINHLRSVVSDIAPTVIALYMPREAEPDLTSYAAELWREGQIVALPRVVQRGMPLVFNLWPPHGPLEPDLLGTPAATGSELWPSLMVIPMVGYARNGFRLGMGGGYYDRTLAQAPRTCRTVGVCFTELEIPQSVAKKLAAAHDSHLDYIVTGKELIKVTP